MGQRTLKVLLQIRRNPTLHKIAQVLSNQCKDKLPEKFRQKLKIQTGKERETKSVAFVSNKLYFIIPCDVKEENLQLSNIESAVRQIYQNGQ
jgi:hypothetical protein